MFVDFNSNVVSTKISSSPQCRAKYSGVHCALMFTPYTSGPFQATLSSLGYKALTLLKKIGRTNFCSLQPSEDGKKVSKNAYFCAFFITFHGRVILPDCLQANFNEFHNFLFLKFNLQEMVLKSLIQPFKNTWVPMRMCICLKKIFLSQNSHQLHLSQIGFVKLSESHLAFL